MIFPLKLRALTALAVLGLSATIAFAQSHPSRAAQPVIIDTDIGDDIDDAFALAYALRTPQFHILGITTTFGDTALRAHIAAHLLDDAHRGDIPVTAGIPSSFKGPMSQAAYGGADTHKEAPQNAAGFILQQARNAPGKVTLIAIGPLLNIGAAIDRDPNAFRKLKRVVVMGGSIDRGYNDAQGVASSKPSSEWNIRNDPESARKLLASGVPVYLMPLDSTQILLPSDLQTQILAQHDSLSQALAELVREANRKVILYDPLTTAFAADATLCPTKPMHIEVDDKGYTQKTPGKPNANVCLKSNETEFLHLLGEKLKDQ